MDLSKWCTLSTEYKHKAQYLQGPSLNILFFIAGREISVRAIWASSLGHMDIIHMGHLCQHLIPILKQPGDSYDS